MFKFQDTAMQLGLRAKENMKTLPDFSDKHDLSRAKKRTVAALTWKLKICADSPSSPPLTLTEA